MNMTKVVINVKTPNYGEVELNVERVIAVIPSKCTLIFEDVYWRLEEEEFNKVYEIWKRL